MVPIRRPLDFDSYAVQEGGQSYTIQVTSPSLPALVELTGPTPNRIHGLHIHVLPERSLSTDDLCLLLSHAVLMALSHPPSP